MHKSEMPPVSFPSKPGERGSQRRERMGAVTQVATIVQETGQDPDLARLVAAWPVLTAEARVVLLAALDALRAVA